MTDVPAKGRRDGSGPPPGVRLGTASWSSEDWKKAGFYPEEMAPRDFLAHYAQRYDTVEVDSTFYRAPSPYLCRKWVKDTPAHFRFSLKATKTITHEKVLVGCEKEWEGFLSAAEELGERLGFVLLQFGYFNKKSACPSAGDFIARLEKFAALCPRNRDVVVEIRNPRWVSREFLAALREWGFAFALVDQEWMPRPGPLWDEFGEALLTQNYVYLRFLGQRKRIEAITKSWDKLVIDRAEETREWVKIVRLLLEKRIPVWAYFNNHYAGYGPGSLDLFARELAAPQ